MMCIASEYSGIMVTSPEQNNIFLVVGIQLSIAKIFYLSRCVIIFREPMADI